MFTKGIALFTGSLLAMGLFAGAALADGDVKYTTAPPSTWKHTEKEVEKAVTDGGYEVRKTLITEGGYFEVYGVKDGQLFELFYNPVNMKLVATIKK